MRVPAILLLIFCLHITASAQTNTGDVKIIFIRHAEKPPVGDNLTCQGINRSMLLPAMLVTRFGIPNYTYVPSLGLGNATKHARMFQTVIPLAAKYNLTINTSHGEKDWPGMAADLKSDEGLVLVVWEHKNIIPIVRMLGVNTDGLKWTDNDYDSIWIVTIHNGTAILTKEKEGLNPPQGCSF